MSAAEREVERADHSEDRPDGDSEKREMEVKASGEQKPARKRGGQMTVDDFASGVRSLRRSTRIRESADKVVYDEIVEDAAAPEAEEERLPKRIKFTSKYSSAATSAGDVQPTEIQAADAQPRAKGNLASVLMSKINDKELYTRNWSSAVPLEMKLRSADENKLFAAWSDCYRDILTPAQYAGDIVKVMSFMNKFSAYFHEDLLTLSFQDFEIGLELVMATADVKKTKQAQDRMNYLFYCLMKILFDKNVHSSFSHYMSIKVRFKTNVTKLRKSIFEWGVPKEWRYLEYIPVFTPTLDKIGLLALEPADRLMMISSLATYIMTQTQPIHDEIYRVTHTKKDIGLSNDSHYVTRYLLNGVDESVNSFKNLCEQIQFHMERKQRNAVKRKRSLKPEFHAQLAVLKTVKDVLRQVPDDKDDDGKEKTAVIMSLYDKWVLLFEGFVQDNPLNNPYTDEVYFARLQDFFVGRIQGVGEFYLPRLHSPTHEANLLNAFVDLRHLLKLFEDYKGNKIDMQTLYSKFYGHVSDQFVLLFHDSPSELSNYFEEASERMPYWFRVSDSSETLLEFIERLDSLIQSIDADEGANDDTKKLTKILKKPKNETARQNIVSLKNYLSNVCNIFRELEEIIKLYDGIKPTRTRSKLKSFAYTEDEDGEEDIFEDQIDEEPIEEYPEEKEDIDFDVGAVESEGEAEEEYLKEEIKKREKKYLDIPADLASNGNHNGHRLTRNGKRSSSRR
ncbi:Esc8p KNAG_0I01490 [Huiozyma naganishii CBS 8797]|uniref:WHIM1 domain-containing protein n=1 Tax=Huiozyma naganishii (strain ATCC MYA-139 / BCRC 22969 / CBS 8797 / KCTC 17520 / NBRC 10181 / NCYC 3082 / Yp74L-3) TaxID=1071383 RepID=J7S2B3_HUIN7|nr:hypothetical protein KNAG_0I01490 [Kazachstania naganishii CBS 8797]CCK71937.1 hypothetical protein KNAG_0I01490 [Kazachstania naganishii CBS 8797]